MKNRAVDEALQRITAAGARSSQPSPLPGDLEGEETAEHEQDEPRASVVWRFFEERATVEATRNPSADFTHNYNTDYMSLHQQKGD